MLPSVKALVRTVVLPALALAACADATGGGEDDLSQGVGIGRERLLSDREMVTPEDAGAPPENAAWGGWVAANHEPVRSLTSGNFADLEFLRARLAGKRVVQLGESSHGVAEYSEAKTRLIRFLHQEMGFDVIAFESGLPECYAANLAVPTLSGADVLRNCLYGVWWVGEAVPLFDYIRSTHGTARPLQMAGFDVQTSGNSSVLRHHTRLLREAAAAVDPAFADSVARTDSLVLASLRLPDAERRPYLAAEGPRLKEFYRSLSAWIDVNAPRIDAAYPVRPAFAALASQTALSTIVFIDGQAAASIDEAIPIRDRGMADNLEFLLERMYPGRKVIVWAHNFHIRHDNLNVHPSAKPAMGMWVAERRRPELYTIALYAYRGRMRSNAGMIYDIFPTPSGSLESIFYRARRRHFFVELAGVPRSPATEWMYVPIVARSSGANEERMVVRDQYDAVLFIDTVRNPAPL